MNEFDYYRNHVLTNGVTVGDYQKKLLEIFLYFKNVCEKNDLRYWCGGGTMLGAVRHKGFIPWDNDLDVFMPRPDYERLHKIWNNVADISRYRLVRTDNEHVYHHTDTSLVDITTTFINKHAENEDNIHGVYIDVMPFEGCPNSGFKRVVQIYHSIMYSVFNAQRIPDNQGAILKFPTWILLNMFKNPQSRYAIWKKHESKMSQYSFDQSMYVKETITSFRGLFRRYKRECFNTIDAEFEGVIVKIPAGYDEYMKRIYGPDYMEIPQNPDMRTRYGVVKYINLDEPYTKYRGIYYLTK